ncbi:MAG: hypothetical protein GY913_13000 [Proteobacteria bacterium]|nr:hypothetical protein [Pseudomonadota bacterium]MCP4917825.1 hypothetical protein [Pseudomonadota bacterium]
MKRLILLAPLLATGCQSTLTGNEGNFRFSYMADDWVNDFNKPVAVGASLDIEVRGVGSNTPVTLSSAAYDDAAVLEVTSFDGMDIIVTGTGDGLALLEGEGELDGETLTDSVNMQAAVPEVLMLAHACSTANEAAYILDRDVVVAFEMQMENTQPVIGYGYYPVELDSTSAAVEHDSTSQIWISVNTGDVEESITMSSTIDDTTLTMELAEEGRIDGVEEPTAWVVEDIDVGDTNAFFIRPMIGELVVCQSDVLMTVASDTPETCAVHEHDPEGDGENETGWFAVEGVGAGTCLYTVTYASGAEGEGVSEQFSYTIEP